MYRLHYAPDNASLIIRLALLELGQPFEAVLVDRGSRAQKSPAFLALNPMGVIPVLETPEGVISETAAILIWLAERHGGLMPAPGAPGRGAALRWLIFLSNTVHADLRMVFYPEQFAGPDPGAQQTLHQSVTTRLRGHLALLDKRVAGGMPGLEGDQGIGIGFGVYLAALLRWAALYGRFGTAWFEPARIPALMAMAAALETRPSVLAAARAEGLGPQPFTRPQPCTPPEGQAF